MINKKKIVLIIAAAAAVLTVLVFYLVKKNGKTETISRIVRPHLGEMHTSVSATGTVLPYNRLEIKPQVNGRMESVLVSEGQKVHKGQILGWMSSTERAALIDAARAQGASSLKYWEDAYKPIAVIAPINGTVIVRGIEPGQAVQTATAILVLSDRLIVKADVDETDIGRVKEGQRVVISLDAYPEVNVGGRVDLIEYESTIVNNVTMYKVNIIPDKVPEVYRSGMTANVTIIEKARKDILLIPTEAVAADNGKSVVWIIPQGRKSPEKRVITVGISDDQNTEVLSGLTANDRVAILAQAGISLEAKKSTNPFMPQRKKMR
ncbi:MAG TPA: efflux RND transporter periplasmic adaptor subunit [Spirochaetota bacterium]|nr:efflux RND transporter periplasmic adaptor subunit [Spirochaetota bacterium]HPC40452.1 efflux RND transporter periplasmic adaptor subunit [Spirochaetota bacterium]HPL15809.1 efflux RND transporter periplasmic adaptor subunit [Spirochaetota bacterium]HQF06519.1 efflux RND transporter periplasmic adaptor subunit [Spirochaetota bacterium]HQH98104.1 efflux RND transporter periplasmic adaptor subunit [Spirochaetota bacterium]